MLKRINWKLIFTLFTWAVCLAGLVVLMSFIAVKKSGERCKELKVLVPGKQSFIESAEVFRIITDAQGQVRGNLLDRIDLQGIESALRANPYIKHAKVFTDMNGIVWVKIAQREPVLHVINRNDQDYYIDSEGHKIPASINFTARVLVANGNIEEFYTGKVDTLRTQLARDLLAVSEFIRRDSLWNDHIEQLYVNTRGEIEMIPLVGDQRIILGNADSLQVKFRNLLAFYKKAIPVVGWNTYKTINIKYANQIVCVKADSAAAAGTTATDSVSVADTLTTIPIKDSILTKPIIH